MNKKKQTNIESPSFRRLVKTFRSSCGVQRIQNLSCRSTTHIKRSIRRQKVGRIGHGTNGAPHDMLDVITDMNYCKDEIYRLYQAVTHR
ncbi:hypothetical protein [Exiguobacterium sp. s130]|uniref:hypothetical protein n=1 Tax=Exiguobacterium sp. s130 TaxID=2751190 RepID=UPI001BE9A0C9|nr:hypothetical protein [Exiguobacterium sp. s130]